MADQPAGFQFAKPYDPTNPVSSDMRYGKYNGTATIPFASIVEANDLIKPALRYQGLQCVVMDGGVVKLYWYRAGVANTDLVPFQADVDMALQLALLQIQSVLASTPPMGTPALTYSAIKFYGFTINISNVGADKYVVEESVFADFTGAYAIYNGSGTSFSITGRTAETTYYHRVVAKGIGFTNSAHGYNSIMTGVFVAKAQVMAAGDSITFGTQADVNPSPVDPATQSYPAQLAALLGTASFGDFSNFGVPGANVQQITTVQIPKIKTGKNGLDYTQTIALLGGSTNDIRIGTAAKTIYANIKTMHKALHAVGIKTILLTPPAFNNSQFSVNYDPLAVELIRKQLVAMLRDGWRDDIGAKGLVDVAAHPIIGPYVGIENIDLNLFQPDGVHFTVAGYGVIAALAKPAVEAVAAGGTYGVVTPLPNTKISALSVNAGRLIPAYSIEAGGYMVELAGSETSITVTVSAQDPTTTIKINGVTTPSGVASASIPINPANNNSIVIALTASDGQTTQIYNINAGTPSALVFDASGSSVATVSSNVWSSSSNGFGADKRFIRGDGFFEFEYVDTANDTIPVGLDVSPSPSNYFLSSQSKYVWSVQCFFYNGVLQAIQGNSVVATTITPQPGKWRLRRTDNICYIDYISSSGVPQQLYKYPLPVEGDLFFKMAAPLGLNTHLTNPRGLNYTIFLPAPASLTLGSASGSGLPVSWSSVLNATNYVLKRNGLTIYSGPSTNYVDTAVTVQPTDWNYTVIAQSGGFGDSPATGNINVLMKFSQLQGATVSPGTISNTSNVAPVGGTAEVRLTPGVAAQFRLNNPLTPNNAVVLVADKAPVAYNWAGLSPLGSVFVSGGKLYSCSGPTPVAANTLDLGTVAVNTYVRMYWQGNDLLIQRSADGISWTTNKNYTGVMLNTSEAVIKAVFAAPATGQFISNCSIYTV